MKRNSATKVAGVMAALTLATSCFAGGTLAKYVTSATGGDQARVAKFGVEITANGDAFATSYNGEGLNASSVTVKSDNDKLVAPGTSGSVTAATISGTPEVMVEVDRSAEVTLAGWEIDASDYYCPLTVSVDGTDVYGMNYTSMSEFEQAIEDTISKTQTYAPGTDLSTVSADMPTVSWKWAFEGSDGKQTDEKDTKLGNLSSAPTIQMNITTSVTQVD